MRKLLLLAILSAMGFVWAGCEQTQEDRPIPTPIPILSTVEVTRQVTVEVTRYATVAIPVEVTREQLIEVTVATAPRVAYRVGSAENPIHLLFSPNYSAKATAERANNLAIALQEATGLVYTIDTPATHIEAITKVCQHPDATIAFMSSLEYVLANQRCNIQPAFAGIRNGIAWTASMVVVPRTSTAPKTLADLNKQSWGISGRNDLINTLYFEALFKREGIVPSEVAEYDAQTTALLALADNKVQFVTANYLPPILPRNSRLWEYGTDSPEIWSRTGSYPERSGVGFIVVGGYVDSGGYQVRDERASVFDVRTNIFLLTKILALSEPFPNDAITFSEMFPIGLANSVQQALSVYTSSEACLNSICASDSYNWEGVAPVTDASYNAIRLILEQLQWDEEKIFNYLGP